VSHVIIELKSLNELWRSPDNALASTVDHVPIIAEMVV
jgi:hypothetical protein